MILLWFAEETELQTHNMTKHIPIKTPQNEQEEALHLHTPSFHPHGPSSVGCPSTSAKTTASLDRLEKRYEPTRNPKGNTFFPFERRRTIPLWCQKLQDSTSGELNYYNHGLSSWIFFWIGFWLPLSVCEPYSSPKICPNWSDLPESKIAKVPKDPKEWKMSSSSIITSVFVSLLPTKSLPRACRAFFQGQVRTWKSYAKGIARIRLVKPRKLTCFQQNWHFCKAQS